MISGLKSLCIPNYHLLTPEQIKSIHTATLELLETTGVDVHHDGARRMLADAGCQLKYGHRVHIPNWLVETASQSAPSRITIYDRLGNEAMRLEGRRVHYGLGTDLVQTYDLETGDLRPSRLKDVAAAARIGDALQHIDFIGSYAIPGESPANLRYLDSFKTELENSIKPIFYTAAGSKRLGRKVYRKGS